MKDNEMASFSHAVYSLRLHSVFVTKYRRKTLTAELLDALRNVFTEILADWRCTLIAFGGEADHVHLLVDIPPALNLSTFKSASSRRMRSGLPIISGSFTGTRTLGTGRTTLGVGGTSLDTVKRYIEAQGTKEKPKAAKMPPTLAV